jgi:hypothetical protein
MLFNGAGLMPSYCLSLAPLNASPGLVSMCDAQPLVPVLVACLSALTRL